MTGRLRGPTMAKYQVTIEFTTRLSREVEANSAAEAEPLADEMFQGVLKGENAHVIGTEHHRSVELRSDPEPSGWKPSGTPSRCWMSLILSVHSSSHRKP